MARPLTNETELYQKIKDNHLTVHPVLWDVMYHHLGDYISAINLIVNYYIELQRDISVDDARKILIYTELIKDTVTSVIHCETSNNILPSLSDLSPADRTVDPLIIEFFMHYIGNDTHLINLVVSFYLDPLDTQSIPLEDADKILNATLSMRAFLDRLRESTHKN